MQRTLSTLVVGLILMLAGCSSDPTSPATVSATGTYSVDFIVSGTVVDTTHMTVDERSNGTLSIAIVLDGNTYTLSGNITSSGDAVTSHEAQPGYLAQISGRFSAERTSFVGAYTTDYGHGINTIAMRATRRLSWAKRKTESPSEEGLRVPCFDTAAAQRTTASLRVTSSFSLET